MAAPKVYVTRRIPEQGIKMLEQHCEVEVNSEDRLLTRKELLENVKGRDGLLCLLADKIDGEVMDAAGELKGIANYAVGVDNISVSDATERGIPVSNTPDVLTDATAEMAWALLFAVSRRVVESDAYLRSGNWNGWGPLQFLGGDVTGTTLGVVGAGRIGTAMALKSRGFDMRVLYTNPRRNERLERECGAERVELDRLLADSDFVSLHTPLRENTHHLITYNELTKMKPTAYLINTARGPVIKEADLLRVLQEERIAGAALDVYEFEPQITAGLEKLKNVVVTPHTGSATVGARTGMAKMAARNLLAMLQGRPAPNCVNPEVQK